MRADSDINDVFTASIKYLNSTKDIQLDDKDRLQLYGYYKQATCEKFPEDFIEFVRTSKSQNIRYARAKWLAWEKVYQQDLSQLQAKLAYIHYVDKLTAKTGLPNWRQKQSTSSESSFGLGEAYIIEELDNSERQSIENEVLKLFEKSSTSAPSQSSTGLRISGYLLLHVFSKTWSLRYFVLDDNILSCYDNDEDLYPTGVVYLHGCKVKANNEIHFGGRVLYSIDIVHEETNKIYSLAARSRIITEAWILRLSVTINKLNNHPSEITSVDLPEESQDSFEKAAKNSVDYTANGEETSRRFKIPSVKYAVELNRSIDEIHETLSSARNKFYYEESGVQVFINNDDAYPVAIGRSLVRAPSRAIWELFWDMQKRAITDPLLDSVEVVQSLGPQTRIEHLVFKAIWPTAPRDFCNLSHWRVLQDGKTILIVNTHSVHEKCPAIPGMIRAELIVSGVLIEPRADNTGCNVAYIIKSNPKGSTPKFMNLKVQSARPLILSRLSKLLEPKYANRLMKVNSTKKSSPPTLKHKRRSLPSGSRNVHQERRYSQPNYPYVSHIEFTPLMLRKDEEWRGNGELRAFSGVISLFGILVYLVAPSEAQGFVLVVALLLFLLPLVVDFALTPQLYSKSYNHSPSSPSPVVEESRELKEQRILEKMKSLTELSNQTTDEKLKKRLNSQIAALLDSLEKL